MRDVIDLYETCRYKVESLGIKLGNISDIKINRRATRKWGSCKWTGTHDKVFTIEISSVLLQESSPLKAAEETMIHELLHTCLYCQNHGTEWKRLVNKVNVAYGYNIKRTSTPEEKGIEEGKRNYKHIVKCMKCEKEIGFMRAGDVVKHPHFYTCKCGGELEVIY